MNNNEKTVSISLVAATTALEKFLASGDLPHHCIDVICTINRELEASASSQDVVLSFLESKLLTSACDTWIKDQIPPLLSEVISELFFLVTSSIFTQTGTITTCLSYRNNDVLHRVCDFFQYFYTAALGSERPILLEPENSRINDMLVSAIASKKVFVTEFIEMHEEFAPLSFFVKNASFCHKHLVVLLTVPCLNDTIKTMKDVLREKTYWGSAGTVCLDKAWKFHFFCEILQPTPIPEFSLTLFHTFLESIESWQNLLFLCIQLLKKVPQNSSVDSIVAESVNCRLALFGSNLGAGLFDDSDEMIVWCFIDTVLSGGSFDLVMGLFYEQCNNAEEAEPESTQSLRRAIFDFVEGSEVFELNFAKELKKFSRDSSKGQQVAIKLSNRRSLFGFFICRVQNFHTNSLRVNRIIRKALYNLCVYNCSHSLAHPAILYREFLGLIEAIHYERPKNGDRLANSPCSSSNQSKNFASTPSTAGTNSMNSFKVPDFLDMELVKNEGHRINMKLFEACLAIVYASIKTRELKKFKEF